MTPPLDSPLPAPPRIFAARANRIILINSLTVLVLMTLAWTAWPTDTARLQMRAADYVEAGNRGDAAASYQFLAPAVRKQMAIDVWAARLPPRRELGAVAVDDTSGQGTVMLSDAITLSQATTIWVKIDRVWYHDFQPN